MNNNEIIGIIIKNIFFKKSRKTLDFFFIMCYYNNCQEEIIKKRGKLIVTSKAKIDKNMELEEKLSKSNNEVETVEESLDYFFRMLEEL